MTQSIAFLYAPEGEMVKDEDGRPSTDAPAPFGDGVRAMVSHERAVLEADGHRGLVLRYGWFYGPAHLLRAGWEHRRNGPQAALPGPRR